MRLYGTARASTIAWATTCALVVFSPSSIRADFAQGGPPGWDCEKARNSPPQEAAAQPQRVEWRGIPLLPDRIGEDIEQPCTIAYAVAKEVPEVETFHRGRLAVLDWEFEERRVIEEGPLGEDVLLRFAKGDEALIVMAVREPNDAETVVMITLLRKKPQ